MQCYCCSQVVTVGRKVKLRPSTDSVVFPGCQDAAAMQAYCEEMTYRWAVVCLPCYRELDCWLGVADIGGRGFGIAGMSRGDKAAVVTEAKWLAFQKKEAAKLGLGLD